LVFHFVNYDREEPADKTVAGAGIQDEKPVAAPEFAADFRVPANFQVKRIEFLTPENEQPVDVAFQNNAQRVQLKVPSFLVYGVLRVELVPSGGGSSATTNRRRVAGLVTEYRHNSHADIILTRLLLTDTLDGRGVNSPLELVSLYADQHPTSDTSRSLAASHGFQISSSIEDALTLGTGKLAVNGVMLIAEHGDYPKSPTGNTQYPKRRFWEETLKVFRASGRVVPVFIDKHLADNWEDAKFIYDTARELGVPLMAGSSLPVTWRRPAADVRRDAALAEIIAITYHTTDAYGFHALEMIQSLAEQRPGGESGIEAVQTLAGNVVWQAMEQPGFDGELFDDAWKRLAQTSVDRKEIRNAVPNPRLFRLQYADGLRANLLELNGAAGEWSTAWRYVDGRKDSALFWTQEGRPGMHFTYLLRGIEQMMLTGEPTWNVERTLLTSGALDALLISLNEDQRRIETPYLDINYQPSWRWTEPPPPPPTRPWSDQ
jgi:hypothetical protein